MPCLRQILSYMAVFAFISTVVGQQEIDVDVSGPTTLEAYSYGPTGTQTSNILVVLGTMGLEQGRPSLRYKNKVSTSTSTLATKVRRDAPGETADIAQTMNLVPRLSRVTVSYDWENNASTSTEESATTTHTMRLVKRLTLAVAPRDVAEEAVDTIPTFRRHPRPSRTSRSATLDRPTQTPVIVSQEFLSTATSVEDSATTTRTMRLVKRPTATNAKEDTTVYGWFATQ